MKRLISLAAVVTVACLLPVGAFVSADQPVLWPGTSLKKVLRSDAAGESVSSVLRVYGARGEVVTGQAVYSPGRDVKAARVFMSDLRRRGARERIPASSVSLKWVRYIDVQKNSSRIPPDELEIVAPNSMPDPFWEGDTVPVRHGTFAILDNSVYIAHRSQPVWIEIRVPVTARAGTYDGVLGVTGDGVTVELPVELHIWNFDVPSERHVSSVTWWNLHGRGLVDVEPYSNAYWERLRRFAEFVVDHRQTDAGLVPIAIVGERGDRSAGYSYDTGNLERYADIVFEAGIERIQIHSVGKLSESKTVTGVGHGVLDRSRKVVPNEEGMRRLPAIEELVTRRNWQGRFAVGISDEPFMHHEESYAAVVDLVHKAAPSVRIIEAVETEHLGGLDIYCPKINHLHMWFPTYRKHQENGAELWFYTSRIPVGRYPNRFIDCSLLKMRVQFWMLYRFGLDGYLFWALNSPYTDDPYSQEAIGRNSPLGNPVIAYPSSDGTKLLGSLRFSAQRDGLEDYEYLWVLEKRLGELRERYGGEAQWLDPRQRSMELCNRVTWDLCGYTRSPDVMLETRKMIADEIEALAGEPLLYVQTSPPEGTVVPAGPRNIGIRGLAAPGAAVTINGDPVGDVRPSGYFRRYHFLLDDEPVITITVEHEGKKRTVKRTFVLTD